MKFIAVNTKEVTWEEPYRYVWNKIGSRHGRSINRRGEEVSRSERMPNHLANTFEEMVKEGNHRETDMVDQWMYVIFP